MVSKKKKVIIIGAGPGGISAAMVLAARGYEVVVYEKDTYVGGRCSAIKAGGFTFDLGPTFIMLPQVFEEVFTLAGRKLSDYVDLIKLDPLYTLHYRDGRVFTVTDDKQALKAEIARLFPGDENGYERYMREQGKKFDHMYPCLKVHYTKWYHYFRPKLLKAFPYMDNFSSIYDVLSRYFSHEDMRIAMTFQAKYLGMSPWTCPGAFTILSYVEHAFGVYHARGGVHMLSEGMARAARDNGARFELGRPIERIIIENGRAIGVRLMDGTEDRADAVVMNADFAYGMKQFIDETDRSEMSDKKIDSYEYSCSTFMIYLGIKGKINTLSHHNIYFSNDYKKNIEQIFSGQLPDDPSFYVQNACVTDPSLAPQGQSTLYVLVPVPNAVAPIDWQAKKDAWRNRIIALMAERLRTPDLAERIEFERIVTPIDWKQKMHVYNGAVFNLAHNIGQMLYLRPHNKFDSVESLYLVGGGTHPGSGLPTIVESGRIAADLISEN